MRSGAPRLVFAFVFASRKHESQIERGVLMSLIYTQAFDKIARPRRTNGPRDMLRCGALILLQRRALQGGFIRYRCWAKFKFLGSACLRAALPSGTAEPIRNIHQPALSSNFGTVHLGKAKFRPQLMGFDFIKLRVCLDSRLD